MASPYVEQHQFAVNANILFEFCLGACKSAELKVDKADPYMGIINVKNNPGLFSVGNILRLTITIMPEGNGKSTLKTEAIAVNNFGLPAPIQPKNNREKMVKSFLDALYLIVKRAEAMR